MKKGFTQTITEKLYFCEILEQIKLTHSRKTSEECLSGKGYDGTFWDGGNNAMLRYAKSLQSCLTLCNPIDSSPPGSPIPGILQARTLEWVAISFSNA